MIFSIWNILLFFSISIVILSVIICSIRMIIGPTLSDRVVALDLIANLIISFISIFCIITNHSVYIDVIIALALVIFLSTVAFANLIAHQSRKHQHAKQKGSNK